MNIAGYEETDVVLAPGEKDSLSLRGTDTASHYFITLDAGTAGKFPVAYAHRIIGELPGGERQFSGTGNARALAYSMPGAEFVTLEFQNITHRANDIITAEAEEGRYRVRFIAVSFD